MVRSPMDVALMLSKLPTCRQCRVSTKAEITGTESSSYTASIRIVCPKCGKASEWYQYDNYCHAIPVMCDVLRKAFADFCTRE